jgi:hypothetical protein
MNTPPHGPPVTSPADNQTLFCAYNAPSATDTMISENGQETKRIKLPVLEKTHAARRMWPTLKG